MHPAPDIDQGWDTYYNNVFHGSTLVALQAGPLKGNDRPRFWLAFAQRFNGRTRTAISDCRLRSGIARSRGAEPSQQAGSSLGIFQGAGSSSRPLTRKIYHKKIRLSIPVKDWTGDEKTAKIRKIG